MLVEMHTGAPLFPGDSDVDQLWLILKCLGRLAPRHAAAMAAHPSFEARMEKFAVSEGITSAV